MEYPSIDNTSEQNVVSWCRYDASKDHVTYPVDYNKPEYAQQAKRRCLIVVKNCGPGGVRVSFDNGSVETLHRGFSTRGVGVATVTICLSNPEQRAEGEILYTYLEGDKEQEWLYAAITDQGDKKYTIGKENDGCLSINELINTITTRELKTVQCEDAFLYAVFYYGDNDYNLVVGNGQEEGKLKCEISGLPPFRHECYAPLVEPRRQIVRLLTQMGCNPFLQPDHGVWFRWPVPIAIAGTVFTETHDPKNNAHYGVTVLDWELHPVTSVRLRVARAGNEWKGPPIAFYDGYRNNWEVCPFVWL